jgi:hypothetical protein
MTTKQEQESPEEKPGKELLLRRSKLMDDIVESVVKANQDAGVESRNMDQYIEWPHYSVARFL